MASFLDVGAPEIRKFPVAILENQQLGWSNSWEATPERVGEASWREKLFEERPAPFEALTDAEDEEFQRLDFHGLLYPDGDPVRYMPQVDSTTDCEGWIYATKPSRLDVPRLGGRASKRLNDRVRRRKWCLVALGSVEAVQDVGSAANAESAMESLWKALAEVIGRRPISEMPVDPTAILRRSQNDVERYQQLCERLLPWEDVPVLVEMLVAALYSRGAYGFTGRRGLFDSLTQGAMVFSIHRAMFDFAEHVDDASNDLAFRDMMGLNVEDVVKTQWKGSALQPVYVVARDHDLHWIVVAVRGTLSQNDILTDCAVSSVPFLGGTAHEGFAKTAQKLLKDIEGILREELAAHPTYQLVFCGHSMGGALGAMCVAILRAKATIPETCSAYTWAKSCRAFGIGTPAVLSRNLGESLAQQKAVYTTVNAQDWSPRASLSNATELLDDLCELSMARTVARLVSGNSYGRGAATAVEPEVEQLPPGVILQIVPGKETKLLKAVGIDYRHDFPAWPDVAAHIPLAYIEGLAKGLRRYVSSDPSRSYCQPAASQALGRVMDATAVCDKAKLPNYPDQARLVVTEQLKHLGGVNTMPL